MLRSKTFNELGGEALDKEVAEWSKNNPNIKVLNSGYSLSSQGAVNGLSILYDDDPKPENSDTVSYKDDFLFRVLMACYSANITTDENGTKINPEDMRKLKWNISRQCPNFRAEHHTCDAARCDKECSYFSSYLQHMIDDARSGVVVKGGKQDDTK